MQAAAALQKMQRARQPYTLEEVLDSKRPPLLESYLILRIRSLEGSAWVVVIPREKKTLHREMSRTDKESINAKEVSFSVGGKAGLSKDETVLDSPVRFVLLRC